MSVRESDKRVFVRDFEDKGLLERKVSPSIKATSVSLTQV